MADRLIAAIRRGDRRSDFSAAQQRMLEFALKLTRTPGEMSRRDVETLRAVGFTDVAIHDIVQVCALFNYYNRLADGLGIDPEEDWGETS